MAHDIVALFCDVMDDIESCGIVTGNIIDIKVNNRLSRALGRCCRKSNGFLIEMNRDWIADNVDEQGVKNTIAHEILHTVEGCFNHSPRWKEQTRKLMAFCPEYSIDTTTSAWEYGYKPSMRYKYKYTCSGCGQTVYKKRRDETLLKWSICGLCKCRFTEEVL